MKITTLSSLFVLLLALVTVVLVALSVVSIREANSIRTTWQVFQEGPARKAEVLDQLHEALGFGGLIHEFKNFVLRTDRQRIIKIQNRLLDLTKSLIAYRSLGVNAQESEAIAAVEDVILRYARAVATAEELAVRGASSTEIDRQVKIDDAPALRGLATLQRELRNAREARRRAVLDAISTQTTFVTVASWTTGTLLVLMVLGFIWFTRTRLLKPLAKLTHATDGLAAGDTAVDVPNLAPETELGRLSHSLEIFKANATERLRAEAALRESEGQFRAVVDNSPAGIVLQDRDGAYRLANRRFEEWYGILRGDAVGRSAGDVFPAATADALARLGRRVLETGAEQEFEQEIAFADGETRPVRVTEFPIVDSDGRLTGVGAIHTDLSGLREAEQQLRQAQKMDAIGQLTGGIAHDFNNLLMIIDGYARRAQKALAEGNRQDGSLNEVIGATDRATKLTRQLLSFSRRQILEKQVFRVAEALEGLDALLRGSLDDRYELRIEAEDINASVETDESELSQAVVNLVINARDAMPHGGAITIRLRTEYLDEAWAMKHRDQRLGHGDYVAIVVEDQGTGIEPAVLDKIFEPFFTTKEQGKGTGLGLSMVYGFARQSGGTVDVDSTPGHGTTITIRLPVKTGGPQQQGAEVPELQYGRGEKVLLVEDNVSLLNLCRSMLEELGYHVLAACDGIEALEVAEDHQGTIDLLLTDVVMPSLGGFELAELMLQTDPKLKVVFMSGYPQRGDVSAKMPSFGQFIQKPVQLEDLATVVRQELDSEPEPRRHAAADRI